MIHLQIQFVGFGLGFWLVCFLERRDHTETIESTLLSEERII